MFAFGSAINIIIFFLCVSLGIKLIEKKQQTNIEKKVCINQSTPEKANLCLGRY